jgi:exonuclease III
VESNPGEKQVTPDFGIISYNCNGLGDKKKLRRLLTKLKPEVEKGKIVFLQETHIVNTDYLNTLWKHKYISNCVKTNSAGVIILFDKNYDIVQQELDTEGRSIVAVIESQDSKLIVANSYFYNNHSLGIRFAETLYTKILTIQNNFPDFVTISAGDFNTCISTNDCLNRLRD